MSNLKELEWFDGGENYGDIECSSLLHNYVVMPDTGGMVKVSYFALSGEHSNKYATGFATVDDAKTWAWNHYNEKMQPYVKHDSITNYFDKFKKWGLDRGIIQNGDTLAQGLKLVSEMGELADNLAKDRCIKDDIGDCMVVLTMLANMTDTPIEDCLAQAWNDIKDRKGTMNEHGVFIKSGDIEEKL